MKTFIIFLLLATAFGVLSGLTNEALQECFLNTDRNHDGVVHLSELFSKFRKNDKNDDGKWNLEEFIAGVQPTTYPFRNEVLLSIYDSMDSVVDGTMDVSAICQIFSLMDVDNNRKAVWGEYKNFATKVTDDLKKDMKDLAGC